MRTRMVNRLKVQANWLKCDYEMCLDTPFGASERVIYAVHVVVTLTHTHTRARAQSANSAIVLPNFMKETKWKNKKNVMNERSNTRTLLF